MTIFTPNTVIRSTEINANFDELKTKTDYLTAPDTGWRYIGAVGQPAFANSWVNYEASETNYNQAKFRKDALGTVYVVGIIKSGTVSASLPVFTLPVGYRPLKAYRFAVVSNGAFGGCPVLQDGKVIVEFGNNNYVFLDGITFKAEQ